MASIPRIGRWEVDARGDATLIASHCRTCGETVFPEREFCPRCRSTDREEARLTGPATLYSWTVVHQAPAGFTAPLAVGYAKLAGDVIVLAPIDGPLDGLARGMTLAIREGQTATTSDGDPMISYRFVVTGDGATGTGASHA